MTLQCANCQHELNGPFCSQCGQPARNRRGPFLKMVSDITEDIFNFDSKFYKSILQLLFKPGYLTRQFIDGRRFSILPPVRMYLVVSILFFFIFQIPNIDVSDNNVYVGNVLLGHEEPIEGKPRIALFSVDDNEGAAAKWFEETFADKKKAMQEGIPQVTVDRIFNQLENLLPNALILFLPIFALVLKLLYFFKRVLYFDHLIFALHFQTWLMGVSLIIYGLAIQNPWWAALSATIPIYLAKAQKTVYEQSYWLVIPKTLLIIVTYIAILSVTAVAAMLAAIALLEVDSV